MNLLFKYPRQQQTNLGRDLGWYRLLEEGLLFTYNSHLSTKLALTLSVNTLRCHRAKQVFSSISYLENLDFQRKQTKKNPAPKTRNWIQISPLQMHWYQWGCSFQCLQHSSGDENQP